MTVFYALYPNNLTADPDDYYSVAQTTKARTKDDIAERMISMGSTVTRADILSVLNDRDEVVRAMLLDGDRVNTSLGSFYISIKGVFTGPDDNYDATRHQFHLNATPARSLVTLIQQNASAKKVDATQHVPQPLRFTDVVSTEVNSVVTLGNVANLNGRRLKFDPADPAQGIFFIAADSTTTRVDIVARNTPSELIFVVPAGLVAGNYTLEVRGILPSTKAIRTGQLAHTLTVS